MLHLTAAGRRGCNRRTPMAAVAELGPLIWPLHIMFLRYTCVLAVALLVGCAGEKRTITPLSQSAVAAVLPHAETESGIVVTNLARQMGVRLENYEQPQVRFDTARREWSYFYWHKPPGFPGGHFVVLVDEAGKTQFIPGR